MKTAVVSDGAGRRHILSCISASVLNGVCECVQGVNVIVQPQNKINKAWKSFNSKQCYLLPVAFLDRSVTDDYNMEHVLYVSTDTCLLSAGLPHNVQRPFGGRLFLYV